MRLIQILVLKLKEILVKSNVLSFFYNNYTINRQKQDKIETKEPLHFRSYLAEPPAAVAGEGVDGAGLILLLLMLVDEQLLRLAAVHGLD